MSFDQSHDQVSLETPRQSVDNGPMMDGGNDQRPADGTSPSMPDGALRERVDNVLQSDIGVSTLLNRLKQSISSVRDFAAFLKERSVLEERHAGGLKRLSQTTAELIRKPENRQGSFAQNYFEVTRVHDRIADHGLAFSIDLHSMSDELQDLATNMERGRKHWKQSGLNAEKKVQDSESVMEKAKIKYNNLADQYDRVRTGEKQGGKFGLKGSKSSAQQEDDLLRKVQQADGDYEQKVHAAQSQRNELLSMLRPQAVKALYDLISISDSALSSQVQKFAQLNERLLLSNGLCINPLKSETNGAGPQPRSLREVAQGVNDERDFQEYVLSFSNKAGIKPSEIRYEKHPALVSSKQRQQPQFSSQQNFNNGQPQYGHPSQSNVGLGVYDQAPRQGYGPGQTTGVTSGPYQNRDGQQRQDSYDPYNANERTGPPQAASSQYGNAPQLPPMDLPMMAGAGGLGNNYAAGPNDGDRAASMPINQNKPMPPIGRADNDPRPGNGPLTQNRVSSQPGFGGQNNYPPSTAAGPGGHQSNMPPAGMRNDSHGGNMRPGEGTMTQNNSYGPGSRNRGPSIDQQDSFGTGQRGQPPISTAMNNQNGPPLGIPRGSGSSFGTNQQSQQQMPSNNYSQSSVNSRGSPMAQNSSYLDQSRHTGPNNSFNNLNKSIDAPAVAAQPRAAERHRPNLPPLNPVFGVSLDELFRRDGPAVPTIVYQCIQAVDLFGLDTEGVYRTSGSAPHIMEMKAMFDNDSSKVDFRTPAAFHDDIASVTTLLKHFLRDLPDPLLTSAQYNSFIQAAKLDDDIIRRDSLHAIINSLPDPNYATLRVLTLHLNRVAEHSQSNRMTPSNIAICFGPTLMGSGSGGVGGNGDIRDAGWQARVVETILANCMQIFDDDE